MSRARRAGREVVAIPAALPVENYQEGGEDEISAPHNGAGGEEPAEPDLLPSTGKENRDIFPLLLPSG